MNSRERESLDRHITGNYGDDQLRDEPLMLSDLMLECANCCESFARAVALEKRGRTDSLRTQLQSIQVALEDLSDRVSERIANL